MTAGPSFFVPAATAEMQESVYAGFAKWCEREVPVLANRIFSIAYTHNGEDWEATVGKTLRGTKYVTRRVNGKKVERRQPLSDPAVVLAIFAGSPFLVVTNHNVGSKWVNPFLVGEPRSITYFTSAGQAGDAPST
jgi:hypothetical protein